MLETLVGSYTRPSGQRLVTWPHLATMSGGKHVYSSSLVSSNYQGFCSDEEGGKKGRPETGGEVQSLSQGHLCISSL